MTERIGIDDLRDPHGMALDEDGFLGRAGEEARDRIRACFSEHFAMAYAGNGSRSARRSQFRPVTGNG